MTYRFTCDYVSALGAWSKGDTAEFDETTAAWMLRDVPGCIEPVVESRAMGAPAKNRQVTAAPKKRGS